jgi:pyruvate dehydrogenase kinase 2/3/4
MVSPTLAARNAGQRVAQRIPLGELSLFFGRHQRYLGGNSRLSARRKSCRSYTASQTIRQGSNPGVSSALPASRMDDPLARSLKQQLELLYKNNRHLSSLASVSSILDDPDLFSEVNAISLQKLASQRPTPLRLADMYKYGRGTDTAQRLRNAQFLYKELPIRVAQRAVDLLTFPHGLSQAEPIRQVAALYLQYLHMLQTAPMPTTVPLEEAYTDLLQQLILDRTSIPVSIARGVRVWRQQNPAAAAEHYQDMEDELYRFFTARVGLRFLIEHHVLSSGRRESTAALRVVTNMFPPDDDDDFLGCIQTNCDVVKEIRKVAGLVQRQTVEYYSSTQGEDSSDSTLYPEIEIVDCNSKQNDDFTYVPHHLHYIVAELLKNSVRATMRHHHEHTPERGLPLPKIKVVIAKGDEDVTIKICDRGGGIPRSRMQTIWKFDHSTASKNELDSDFGTDALSGARVQGFGLPLARIYARYFGGELTLKSCEGHGLDAYVYLPRLGDSCENVPLRVRDSPGAGDSMPRKSVG